MPLKSVLQAAIVVVIVLLPSITRAEEFTVTQTNKTFMIKGVKVKNMTIKAGDTIIFLNEDPWFHNIFSLSDTKSFYLGSYPQGQSKSATFEKPGHLDVECAIHAGMLIKLEVK